jgi:hypothetical protein
VANEEYCALGLERANTLRGKTRTQINFLENVKKQGWCSVKQAEVIDNIKMQINGEGIYSRASRRRGHGMSYGDVDEQCSSSGESVGMEFFS